MSNPSDSDRDPVSKAGSSAWPLVALLVAAALVLFVIRPLRTERQQNSLAGAPLPPLEVAGWLNAAVPPDANSLRGQVVLVDFWATWCGYCVEEMPDLVRFYQRYRDQGLVLIGLTDEMGAELPAVEAYVAGVDGLDWPIGYGAGLVFDRLGIEALPTHVLFDRSGRVVWAGYSLDGLEDAVVAALAKEKPEAVSR